MLVVQVEYLGYAHTAYRPDAYVAANSVEQVGRTLGMGPRL